MATTPKPNPLDNISELYNQTEFYIGLGLAVSSSFFIGSSFIIKKKALIQLNRTGHLRASAGGFGYLKQWLWWAGLITSTNIHFTNNKTRKHRYLYILIFFLSFSVGIGEAANFAAYAFAPASLVTPLGALSVLVTSIMASKFLNERLNLLGKLGCLLCILGSTIIVLHSPKEVEVEDLNVLIEKLQDTTFILYVIIVTVVSLLIAFYIGPRMGHLNVAVYVVLCSAIGSLTVMSCKALGLALRDTISGKSNDFGLWLPYVLILTTIIFIFIQMNYLNKALDIFNTSIVTPIYYVIFTTLVIVASAILFKEWRHMSVENVIGDLCGFCIVVIAVILLNAFQNAEISISDLRQMMRPRRDPLNQKSMHEDAYVRQTRNGYGTRSDDSANDLVRQL